MTAWTTLLLLLGLALSVAAWLAGPALWRALRRARIRRQPFPQAWREVLRQRMPAFRALPSHLQLQLKKQTQVLLATTPFVGCNGLVVTTEMRVLVAAQAAMLLLNRHAGSFRNLRQVLLYPQPFIVRRATPDGLGLVDERGRVLSGESWQQGLVILSWPDVLAGAAAPADGHNVVIHEFAHQLDQETGRANGAPFVPGHAARQRWAQTMKHEFDALTRRLAQGEAGLIDAYGATDPAEFFAVTSELFFERPQELATAHPALFHELSTCYRINPLSW